jgi:uncharacterized membrane protein AbrB (regulator of aidB expression)
METGRFSKAEGYSLRSGEAKRPNDDIVIDIEEQQQSPTTASTQTQTTPTTEKTFKMDQAVLAAKTHCRKFRQYFSSIMIGILLLVALINITFDLKPNSKHDLTIFWTGTIGTIGGAMMGLAFKKTAGNEKANNTTAAADGSNVSLV